jgi:hypothetical protein
VNKARIASLLATAALLAGCGGTNGTSINPPTSPVNLPKTAKLQFAVGTINFGPDAAAGLNTVVTFRQPNGLSAVLVSTPKITGPAGFTVPNTSGLISPYTGQLMQGNGDGGSGADAGTASITATPQLPPSATPPPTTFGQSGGAFSYGFAPDNADQNGTTNFSLYLEPFYSENAVPVYGGPPAYPFIYNGTFPAGFVGYTQGWTAFETTPVAGQYSLSVAVQTANAPSPSPFAATATLTNTTPLPSITTAAFTPDGAGGGTITATIPADPRIVETLAYVANLTTGLNYTVGPTSGTGAMTFVLPPTLGACSGSNCQSGSSATPTLNPGDNFLAYVVSYDYPMFEASPPGNTSQTPAITGSTGQADLSVSNVINGTY